nr:cytochrome P450 78A6-like [Ipomoea trifida]
MFDRVMGFAPYGVYWRTLRKIADNHLFSQRQICAYETRIMMCLVFGRKYDEVEEVIELVQEGYGILAQLNLSDHLPWLANFYVQKAHEIPSGAGLKRSEAVLRTKGPISGEIVSYSGISDNAAAADL